ncbi:MAG TPA: RNA polymerase sigma-70 factor [Pedobacter sp.]|nr:RNA polymerase sigma-70 factor [Pedobacter sp.]
MAAYSALTDSELVDLMRSGDRDAFTEVYDRYAMVLLNHANNKTRDREAARDHVQEVFSNLWLKRESLQVTTTLSGFLYTAVRNLILNQVIHKAVEDKYMASLLHFVNTEQVSPDHQIRERQLKEHIEKEIEALPAKMREVFELSRNEHLSHREIAERLNISEQTVSKHVSNAIKILKVKLHLFVVMLAGSAF